MVFLGAVRCGPINSHLDCGGSPAHDHDTGIFKGFFSCCNNVQYEHITEYLCHILRLKCTCWGSDSGPAGGAYSAPPVLGGLL